MTARKNRKKWRVLFTADQGRAHVVKVYPSKVRAYDRVGALRDTASKLGITEIAVDVDDGSGWQLFEHFDLRSEQ